jgi:hypothetical protein
MPNPSYTSTDLQYKLGYDTQIKIGVYDLIGNLILEVADGKQAKGNHHFSIGTLPSGVYLVRMATELQTVTQRLIRLN